LYGVVYHAITAIAAAMLRFTNNTFPAAIAVPPGEIRFLLEATEVFVNVHVLNSVARVSFTSKIYYCVREFNARAQKGKKRIVICTVSAADT
jgi:hypothetical protein